MLNSFLTLPKIKHRKNKICWQKNRVPCVCRLLKPHSANNAPGSLRDQDKYADQKILIVLTQSKLKPVTKMKKPSLTLSLEEQWHGVPHNGGSLICPTKHPQKENIQTSLRCVLHVQQPKGICSQEAESGVHCQHFQWGAIWIWHGYNLFKALLLLFNTFT